MSCVCKPAQHRFTQKHMHIHSTWSCHLVILLRCHLLWFPHTNTWLGVHTNAHISLSMGVITAKSTAHVLQFINLAIYDNNLPFFYKEVVYGSGIFQCTHMVKTQGHYLKKLHSMLMLAGYIVHMLTSPWAHNSLTLSVFIPLKAVVMIWLLCCSSWSLYR